MKKVDIAIFMPSLRGGGAEKVMLTLAIEFSRLGYCVELVLAQAIGEYVNQVPDNIKIVDLKSNRVIKSIFPLIQYIRKKSPSILFSTQNHANCVAIIAKAVSFKSTKVFVRESNTVSVNSGKHKSFIDKNMPYFIRFLYPFSSKVIAVSNGVSTDLSQCSKLKKSRITTIYNPVVNDQLYKKANEKVHHPWLLNKTLPVVLAIGRLTKQKDFPTLICAVEASMHTKPFRLIILGEGELKKELEALVDAKCLQGFVSFPGFVENPFPYMKQSDVFVLSSLWEGLPNVLIQALSLGGKVVATDCPSGPKEILYNGKYGILVPCNNVPELLSGIQNSLGLALHEEEVLAKKEYCKNHFGSSSIANKYLDLFKRYQSELK